MNEFFGVVLLLTVKKKKELFRIIVLCVAVISILVLPFAVFGGRLKNTGVFALSGEKCIDFGIKAPVNAAKSAIVIDARTGNVLFSSNADEKRGMASTTKIMTALLAIESCDPEAEFQIPAEAVGVEGSSVYLKEGEPLTLRELLYCLMLESGNDAATAIAVCLAGSTREFAEEMNSRAKELGLKSTRFANPHGLSSDGHYTTARELAIITAEAMKYPLFREIVATKSYKVRYNGVENARHLTNHNKLLFGYDGANGVKTGYTAKDGRCLVSSAERDGMFIIAVTLCDPFPTSTHKTLLDAAFDSFEQAELALEGEITAEIPVINGESAFVKATNAESVSLCLPKGSRTELSLIVPESINAPAVCGETAAYAVFSVNGKEVYIINLETTASINEKKKSFFEKIFGD